jgi:hypothetical protein
MPTTKKKQTTNTKKRSTGTKKRSTGTKNLTRYIVTLNSIKKGTEYQPMNKTDAKKSAEYLRKNLGAKVRVVPKYVLQVEGIKEKITYEPLTKKQSEKLKKDLQAMNGSVSVKQKKFSKTELEAIKKAMRRDK